MMDNTVIYCRTANSDVDIVEMQEEMLKQYAQANGYNLKATYCDWNVSGVTLDRPALKKLLSDVCAGKVQRIIVKDISRLARSFFLAGELFCLFSKYGVELIAVNDGGVVDTLWKNNDLTDAMAAFLKKEKKRRSKAAAV